MIHSFDSKMRHRFAILLLSSSLLSVSSFVSYPQRCPTTIRYATRPPNVPNFCSECGSDQMALQVPPGDERLRACCQSCGAIVYVNPKVVVACVLRTRDSRFLLGKRSIEPRLGYWGIPQGFLELDETTREGACREVREEVGVEVKPSDLRLAALYNVPGSVQIVYDAVIQENELESIPLATLESSEIGLFSMDELPDLCFPTVQWALDYCSMSENEGMKTGLHVQQKTKMIDFETGEWRETEDL